MSILIYTVASVTFQLPATVAVKRLGPRVVFPLITVSFGIITLVSLLNLFYHKTVCLTACDISSTTTSCNLSKLWFFLARLGQEVTEK